MKKKVVAMMLAAASCISLTGCTSFIHEDVAKYPLVNQLTNQEVVDYYAKALDYDAVVDKNVTVHETTYEVKDVQGSKETVLKDLVSQAEGILSAGAYDKTPETKKVLNEDTYNYLKATLDNEQLSDGQIQSIKGALGYYFVDVKYNVGPAESGEFEPAASMLGLDGVWVSKHDGSAEVDSAYLSNIADKLNKYFEENVIDDEVTVTGDGILEFKSLTGGSDSDEDSDEDSNAGDYDVSIPGADAEQSDGEDNSDDVTSDTAVNGEDIDNDSIKSNYTDTIPDERKIKIDLSLINRVVGSSLAQKAFLPSLDTVYKTPDNTNVGGYGVYPAGSEGLKLFGFNRDDLAGDVTIRYVFKDADDASGNIVGTNAYVTTENITNGFNVSDQNVIIPDFLNDQLDEIIERADRVQSNIDLSGMLSGNVYADLGPAVLAGFKDESSRTLRYMSTIRQVLARDTADNAYLVEVETTLTDGPRSVDCYGTYKDKYYAVIQQKGNSFLITDMLRVAREMTNEPPIYPNSSTEKRLVALNLAGEVAEDDKTDIKSLMGDLYQACTYRILKAKDDDGNYKKIKVNGKTQEIKRGMYDCFDKDRTMLTQQQGEYITSYLRGKLTKYGANVGSQLSGTITEWIGGYDNQAEFTTEELIQYDGRDTGYYMTVYYLVSKMGDDWAIDERKVMSEEEVTGNDLSNAVDRITK